MTMSIRAVFGGVVLLLFFGLSPGFAQEAPEATMSCGDCHEDVAKAFAKNPHARAEVECEVCHDGGSAHMEAGGDPSLVKIPRGFDGAENTCLGCHDRTTERRSPRMGAHANSPAVNCLSCHSVHHAQETSLVAKPQPELCASCHGTKLEGQPDWRRRLPNGRMPAPPHDETGHTWHHADALLFAITKQGLVPPHAPAGYESDMPAFGKTLSDEEIWAALAYIKSLWTSREVREARAQMGTR